MKRYKFKNNYFTFNHTTKLSKQCLRYSIIGRNTDIINHCMKDNKMSIDCLRDILKTHNNEMLEYVLERKIFTYKDFDADKTFRGRYERDD